MTHRRPFAGQANGAARSARRRTADTEGIAVETQLLDYFRQVLLDERSRILNHDPTDLKAAMKIPGDEMRDETDLAAAVYNQSMTLRLRDRERRLLKKIAYALDLIEEGEFGYCERCGDAINVERLKARPVTTLCIECKQAEERDELPWLKQQRRAADTALDLDAPRAHDEYQDPYNVVRGEDRLLGELPEQRLTFAREE